MMWQKHKQQKRENNVNKDSPKNKSKIVAVAFSETFL